MAGESILLTTVNWLPTSELISSMSKMDYQGQNVDHYFSLFVSYMEVDLKPTTLSSTLLLQAGDAI